MASALTIESIYKEHINPELARTGFMKRASGVFTMEVAPGVLGWLGLNQATQHHATGEFHINPIIGVKHQEVEKIAAECCGKPFHAYTPATIDRPIGYIMPENTYKTWDFTIESAGAAARAMAETIVVHGISFNPIRYLSCGNSHKTFPRKE